MTSGAPANDDSRAPTRHVPGSWHLHLYVAGMTPVARRALANLQEICEAHLPGRCSVQVTDLLEDRQIAEDLQIVAVPTLVRESPHPVRRVIGDLSDTARVLVGLDLDTATEA